MCRCGFVFLVCCLGHHCWLVCVLCLDDVIMWCLDGGGGIITEKKKKKMEGQS